MQNVQSSSAGRRGQLLLGTLLTLLCPIQAYAGSETHIKLRNAEIIPSLTLGAEYRSNAYLTDTDPEGASCLLVQPQVSVKAPSQYTEFSFSGTYSLRKYLSQEFSNLDRFRDFALAAKLVALPRSMVGFELSDSATNSSRPSEADMAESALISRFTNNLDGALVYRPGPALELRLGGNYKLDDYSVPKEATPDLNSAYNARNAYGPLFAAKWFFLPRTAVIIQASTSWYDWRNNIIQTPSTATQEHGQYIGLPDGSTWRVQAGMTGRITERLAIQAIAGYGQLTVDPSTTIADANRYPEAASEVDPQADGFGDNLSGTDGVLLTINATYEPEKDTDFVFGYEKGFRDTYFDNYLAYHKLFARVGRLMADHYILEGGATYRFEAYGGEWDRKDHIVRLNGTTGYRATRYFDFTLSAWWDRRASADHRYPEIEFDDFGLRLAVKATY